MTYSFLLIGQSNMAGRGYVGDVDLIFDEQILMLRNGLWQTMWEPINPDRPFSGVSLASSFASAWRGIHPEDSIGLIPCAEGGSSLDDWTVGGNLYRNAVFQGGLAQQTSTIAGILWHQGENDCFPDLAASYQEKFSIIINALRKELQLMDVPLILGGLGDFLTEGRYGPFFSAYPLVNKALLAYAESTSNSYFVSSKGLTANPDGLHFDARSLRKLGIRYFEAFQRSINILDAIPEEDTLLQEIYKRPLTLKEQATLLEYRFAFGELTLQEMEQQLEMIQRK